LLFEIADVRGNSSDLNVLPFSRKQTPLAITKADAGNVVPLRSVKKECESCRHGELDHFREAIRG
jgi:hypothetical protein